MIYQGNEEHPGNWVDTETANVLVFSLETLNKPLS